MPPIELDINGLLSDQGQRQAAIDTIEAYSSAHQDDPLNGQLNAIRDALAGDVPLLTPDQIAVLERIIGNGNGGGSLLRSAAMFSDTPPLSPPPVVYVERLETDTLRTFIERNLGVFGLGRDVPAADRRELIEDFYRQTGIRFGSMKRWGSQSNGSSPVEPQSLEEAKKVYLWLEKQAAKRGKHIDVWDFVVLVFPQFKEMIADAQNGEIALYVPEFLEGVNFEERNYQSFVRAAHIGNLISDVPQGTRSSHWQQRRDGHIVRPRWETHERFATLIDQNTTQGGDEEHRQRLLQFQAFFTRILPIIEGIAPIVDEAGRTHFAGPDTQYRTRYRVTLLTEEGISYQPSGWPFSQIVNGQFDQILSIMESRIGVAESLSSLLSPSFSIDIAAENLSSLRSEFEKLKAEHETHRQNLSDPNPSEDVRSFQYIRRVKSFYTKLQRSFESLLFYTHIRGTVNVGNISIPFEVVPRVDGTPISPSSNGRVSVIAEDIIATAAAEQWPNEKLLAVFQLRVFTAWQVAGGIIDRGAIEDTQKIIEAANHFGQILNQNDLQAAAQLLARLNLAANDHEAFSIDPELHRAIRLRTTGTTQHRAYYVYDYSMPWREQMALYYSQNNDSSELDKDARIAENYFQSVRHPHFIYDPAKLRDLIAADYETDAERQFAFARISGFFEKMGLRTDASPIHPFSAGDTNAEGKAIEWAFEDYKALFPGANELGAAIEVNDRLISEVVDRQIALHPDVRLRRNILKRGVLATIERFNTGRSASVSEITADFHPLPAEGIFPERFHAYVADWGMEHRMSIYLDGEKLLSAFYFLRTGGLSQNDAGIALVQVGLDQRFLDENEAMLFDYVSRARHEVEWFGYLASPERVGAYINDHYSAPAISARTASAITIEYLKARLTTPYPVDLEAIIVAYIGDRFDPYPAIKAEVVAFYHMMVREYLNDTYVKMVQVRDSAIMAIDNEAGTFLGNLVNVYLGSGLHLEEAALSKIESFYYSPEQEKEIARQLSLFPNRLTQNHPSIEVVAKFDSQLYLLAEALNEPPPSMSIEDHLLEAHERITPEINRVRDLANRRFVDQRAELIEAEKPIRAFAASINEFVKAFKPSDAMLSGVDNMGAAETSTALANIERGLALAAGFETELNGPMLAASDAASSLADRIGETDDASELYYDAERALTGAKDRLVQYRELLELRRDEINETQIRARTQTAADEAAIQTIFDAEALMARVETLSKQIKNISEEITGLREEIRSSHDTQPATHSLIDYQAAWDKMEEFRNRANALRRRQDDLRAELDSLSPAEIYAKMGEIHGTSEPIRALLSTTRKYLVRTISETRSSLEQAEGFMVRLGGTLLAAETRLGNEEVNIPVPAGIQLPSGIELSASEMAMQDNTIVVFNTAIPRRDPSNRIAMIKQEIGRLELLVVGDRSYIVSKTTADSARTWLAARTTPFRFNDIFGQSVFIDSNMRGIRVVKNNDALLTFQIKLNILLTGSRSNEADFVVKLYERAQNQGSYPAATDLWRRLLAELASADVLSERDAKIFIRRFAVTHGEEVEALGFSQDVISGWFVERQSPLQIELADEMLASLETKPIEEIERDIGMVGWASQEGEDKKQQILREMKSQLSQAIKPFLTSSAREWWTAHENEIPDGLAMTWMLAHQAHDTNEQKMLFLQGLAEYLEVRRIRNGGRLMMEPNEMLRYARRFIIENMVEIRFHTVLYDGNELLYGFETQMKNAMIFRMFVDQPELQTLTIRRQGEEFQSIFVSIEDLRRFKEALAGGQTEITLQNYNYMTAQFGEMTIELKGLSILDDKTESRDEKDAVQYASLLHTLYSEEELIGAGFMIAKIIKERKLNPVSAISYDRLWEILGEFDARIQAEPDHIEKLKLLADLEVEIFQLYMMGPMAYATFHHAKNAIENGIRTFLGEAWDVFPDGKRQVYLNAQTHAVLPALAGHPTTEMSCASEMSNADTMMYDIDTQSINQFMNDQNIYLLPNTIPVAIPVMETIRVVR